MRFNFDTKIKSSKKEFLLVISQFIIIALHLINFNLGERDKPEMQLYYGYEKDPNFFLNNEYFQELSIQLYKPLIESFL